MKMEYLSVGNYEINGRKIFFSTTSVNGTVKYRGRITNKGILKLKIESLINGFKHREKYQFVLFLKNLSQDFYELHIKFQ